MVQSQSSPLNTKPVTGSSDSITSSSHPDTPKRSFKSSRTLNDTPNAKAPFNSIRNLATLNKRLSIDADLTPRKGHGLPTPPYSEPTSSASGSVGRTRKDSQDTTQQNHNLTIPDHSKATRSPSVDSSFTDSDTVGARSPIDAQSQSHSHSRSPQSATGFDSTMAVDTTSRYNTVARKKATGLASGLSQISVRSSSSPLTPNHVDRSSSSLGFRSSSVIESSERTRKSAIHEQDVSIIRSESRLGKFDNPDDESDLLRPTQHRYSPRKSTRLSKSRYTASHDQLDPSAESQPPPHIAIPRSPNPSSTYSRHQSGSETKVDHPTVHSQEPQTGSVRLRNPKMLGSSPISEALSLDSLGRAKSSRSPLPIEFRLPDRETRRAVRATHARQLSGSVTSETSEDEHSQRLSSHNLPAHPDQSQRRPYRAETNDTNSQNRTSSTSKSSQPRRRYASDAHSEEVAALDYEGRLGNQASRISVDSSSANRYLSNGQVQATPVGMRRSSHASEFDSPSEEARARKVSTSSSRSHKSSSGASDLRRTASRASMRRALGRDVFDDEALPPLPVTRSDSPSVRTERSGNTSERVHALRHRYGELKQANRVQHGWLEELNELRHRIEELAVTGSSQPSAHSGSQSPSVTSQRTHSALAIHRTPSDTARIQRLPATEPPRSRHERSSTLPELEGAKESQAIRDWHEKRSPRTFSRASTIHTQRSSTSIGLSTAVLLTPETTALARSSAASRASLVHSATLPSTSRFPSATFTPSASANRVRSEGSLQANHPVHDRNMHNAFDIFERYFSAAPLATTSSTATASAGPESLDLVTRFRDVVTSASEINSTIRQLIQLTLEAQIDAEMADKNNQPGVTAAAHTFTKLDKGLTQVLRKSDEQVRNLTDGLIAFTRAERERDRQRKDFESVSKPGSRMSSSLASPIEEVRRIHDTRSSLDLRRSSCVVKEPVSPAATLIDHGSHSDSKNSQSRNSEQRYLTLGRAPVSPYSPLQSKVSLPASGGTLTKSQSRSVTSMGLHARSASEFSPPSALKRERPAILSNVSKPPTLSPRKPKLSFPSVSNATASFNPSQAEASESPETARGVIFPSSQDESAAKVLARTRGLTSEPSSLDAPNTSRSSRSSGDDSTEASTSHETISRRHTITIETSQAMRDELQQPTVPSKTSSISKRMSSSTLKLARSPPPRPPRHDLMQSNRHGSLELSRTTGTSSTSPSDHRNDPTLRHENTTSTATSVTGRFGSITRSLGRSASRRFTKPFTTIESQPPLQEEVTSGSHASAAS